MSNGTSLDHQHQQGDDSRDTYPNKDEQPTGLKKEALEERVKHAKVGSTVAYTKGHGTIVSKSGSFVTIYNSEADAYDTVHAGETYIPGDTISMGVMNQLWDQMQMESRVAALHKANIQDIQHFVDRNWSQLPMSLKDVLKLMPGTASNKPVESTMTPQGRNTLIGTTGSKLNTGRTLGEKKPTVESKGPERKRKPAGEGAGAAAEAAARRSTGAPGPKKESKDEGVTFATGLDKATNYGELATEIYKLRNSLNKVTGAKIPGEKLGDLPTGKDPRKVGGTKLDTPGGEKTLQSPADRYGGEKIASDVEHGAPGGVVTDTPFDATEDYEEKRPEVVGNEFDYNPQKTPKDLKDNTEEVRVGFHKKDGDGGVATTSTPGTNNAVYDEKKIKKGIVNKYNTRYGMRQASQEDIDRLNK